MPIDLAPDELRRALPEPLAEHPLERAPIARRRRDDECIPFVVAAPGDARPAHGLATGPGTEVKAMELAAIADEAPVDEPAACLQHLPNTPLALEMAPQPRLALLQERLDDPLGPCPATTRRQRDRNDDAPACVHGDAQPSAAGQGPERILDLATG